LLLGGILVILFVVRNLVEVCFHQRSTIFSFETALIVTGSRCGAFCGWDLSLRITLWVCLGLGISLRISLALLGLDCRFSSIAFGFCRRRFGGFFRLYGGG